jgi:hypothetical protein
MKTLLASLAIVGLATVLRPALFVGSASWAPAVSLPLVTPARHAVEFPTVNVGDTITVSFSTSTLETACYKTLGQNRIVVKACPAGGFHVWMYGFVKRVAVSADSVTYATPARLSTLATSCDSAKVRTGVRGDSTADSATVAALGCPVR